MSTFNHPHFAVTMLGFRSLSSASVAPPLLRSSTRSPLPVLMSQFAKNKEGAQTQDSDGGEKPLIPHPTHLAHALSDMEGQRGRTPQSEFPLSLFDPRSFQFLLMFGSVVRALYVRFARWLVGG
eukprot:scaffold21954_cov146-Isochrysis_galbana.AAC.4